MVEYSAEIEAPVGVVFDYIDDHTNTRDWMYGLRRIEHVGGDLHGTGAVYDGTMKIGMTFHSTIECTAWKENELIELTSVKGLSNTQQWTFHDLGDDRTRVDARISYSFPGGPAGRAAAQAVKPFVGVFVRSTSENLTKNVEALHQG